MVCNWGVLGAGFIANRAMIPAIQQSSNARVLALASRDEQRGREITQRYGIERVYSDYETLLDDPDVQVVYIALPNSLHREWAIRAAHAGKHVLCEKPLALNTAECDEIISTCHSLKVLLMEAV
ncbi:MAG TPA: Gfo/Idh/MocA family oxidoreductase, partial [Ktedonobacteraceae bacterium]